MDAAMKIESKVHMRADSFAQLGNAFRDRIDLMVARHDLQFFADFQFAGVATTGLKRFCALNKLLRAVTTDSAIASDLVADARPPKFMHGRPMVFALDIPERHVNA